VRRDAIPYFSQLVADDLYSRTGCGMACTQMLLAARGQPVPPLRELWERCAAYGGYRPDGRRGLHYAGWVEFAAAELGLRGRVAAPLALDELMRIVAGDEVVIASVHRLIRDPAPAVAQGGHLVLVVDAAAGQVCFHNPSGHTPETQRHVWMDAERFGTFYAERGIVVELPRAAAA
jgi:Peptidase_C39 like family